MWMAYLNLENMYGTQETVQSVFERAVQHNEPLKVFQQFVTMCTASGKFEVFWLNIVYCNLLLFTCILILFTCILILFTCILILSTCI